MSVKLRIEQSIKVVRAAVATHLDSFKESTAGFSYEISTDELGIHYFVASLNEYGYEGWRRGESNLGSIKLRQLGVRRTELVIEDSIWLHRGPNLISHKLDRDYKFFSEQERKDSYDRIRSIHRQLREYIIQSLVDDEFISLAPTEPNATVEKSGSQRNNDVRVFISYAHEDTTAARRIFEQLESIDGIRPWFDKESLLPGMRWKPAITKAIREADFFLALLSKKSTTKKGYVQTEMKQAFDIWDQFPEDKAYLIPLRLEDCNLSYEKLREVQYQDLFPFWEAGFHKVLEVIRAHKSSVNQTLDTTTATTPIVGYEYRCAIIDLDNGLPNLGEICLKLNSIQNFFHFASPNLSYEHTALRSVDGAHNLYVPGLPKSFYKQKKLLNADLVICLTRYLLAFTENRKTFYDYLSLPSDVDDTFKFVTTHGLYETGREANCTFEKAVVYHILTQLLIHFSSDLGFHNEVRGCILDFCEEHRWMIKGMKRMRLCVNCGNAIESADLKKAVLAVLANPIKV